MSRTFRIIEEIRAAGTPKMKAFIEKLDCIYPGGYGEGDEVCGTVTPVLRKLAKKYADADAWEFLQSPLHEARMLGLFIMGDNYEGKATVDLYIAAASAGFVNNWDLVDSSANKIVGRWCFETEDLSIMERFARSENLWENRITMVATQWFIKRGSVAETLHFSKQFLDHPHHLMHKAMGWMLREAWKAKPIEVEEFLALYREKIPKTAMQYACERMGKTLKTKFLLQAK